MKRVTSTAFLLAGISTWAIPALASDAALEEIVVTGSRVIKNGDDNPLGRYYTVGVSIKL